MADEIAHEVSEEDDGSPNDIGNNNAADVFELGRSSKMQNVHLPPVPMETSKDLENH